MIHVLLLSSAGDDRFILTDRFNQDPVEIYFGQERSRGHRNNNPSVQRYMKNTQALIVQKALALGGSSNISKKKRLRIVTTLPAPPKTPKSI